MKRTKIVVSVLGDFSRYEEVGYIFDSNGDKSILTKFSATAIAKSVDANVLLIMLPFSVSSAICPETLLTKGVEEAVSVLSSRAKEYIMKDLPPHVLLYTAVLPNAGRFIVGKTDKEINIFGSPGSFHEAVYVKMLDFLKQFSDVEIYLDVTHAINNLVLDAVDAIISSARTLSAIDKIRGNIRIFYSDPFFKGGTENYLHLRQFKREILDSPVNSSSIILSSFLSNFNANDYTKALSAAGISNEVKLVALKKLAHYHNTGCVLLTSSLSETLRTWQEKIEQVLEKNLSEPYLVIEHQGDNLLTLKCSQNMSRELSVTYSVLYILTSEPFDKGKSPTLDDLCRMSRLIPEPGSLLLKDEIDHIEMHSEEIINSPVSLKHILMKAGVYQTIKDGNTDGNSSVANCKWDDRNFIAHGGMEANITYVFRDGDMIRISYGNCLEEMKKCLNI